MQSVAQHLRDIIQDARPRLVALDEPRASAKPYPDKWSVKEILGHLIDSAANNHQRFVRMQSVPDLGVYTYEQLHWVTAQNYQAEPWEDVIFLWYAYNKHLAHVIEHIDPASLIHMCEIGYPKPATLQYIVEDYLRHLHHHLDQIFSDTDPMQRSIWVPRQD